jgi:hypothetical protein
MKSKAILLIIFIPLLFAFFMRIVFGIDSWGSLYSVMTITFLFSLPYGVGVLTIALSKKADVKSLPYRIIFPWIPIFLFFVLTLLFSLEGWACWLMVLPLFLLAASLGGLTAGYFKLKDKPQKLHVSLIVLLPLMLSPLEKMLGTIPGTYRAYTSIDIHSSREEIWRNVTRVPTIAPEQDKGWLTQFLGFPRPIRAELNYEGVGASREAVFEKGLVFHEAVTAYTHQQQMRFSIKAYPHEIPAATMDEHVVIGGDYFDVLDGTYELEQLAENQYRLHLYSHFTLKTSFNFYASFWAGWIMRDIQNNILQVVKVRAEGN